jgi:O-antigen ligase
MTWDGPRLPAAPDSRQATVLSQPGLPFARELPRWPLTIVFIGVPLWWVTGIGDFILPIAAALMLAHLVRRGRVEVPRGFGLWLLFLLWMLFSVIEIDSGGRLLGFVYRAAIYGAVTIILLYVYNGRRLLTGSYLAGMLTGYWLLVVFGGYLGVLVPLFSITTPLAQVLPSALLENELVREMAFRRVTQFNPDSFLALDARPSAPFLYTNGWGNAYSLLMPVVIAYLGMVRGRRRFWWILAAVPLSFVPAFLTLNRGMFIGLGLALAYGVIRLALRGRVRAVAALVGILAVVAAVFVALPAQERLSERLDVSATTQTRYGLYQEAVERTLESPLFGYGAPRPSESPGSPSVGTQGQVWTVLFSHGFPGLFFYLAWLVWAFVRTCRHPSALGLAFNTVLLLTIVEGVYYGVLTTGLPIAMIAAGYALRQPEETTTDRRITP